MTTSPQKNKRKLGRPLEQDEALMLLSTRLHPDLIGRIDRFKQRPQFKGNRRLLLESALNAYFTTLESA